VTSLCPKDETSGPTCNHKQIRPAGSAAFEDHRVHRRVRPDAGSRSTKRTTRSTRSVSTKDASTSTHRRSPQNKFARTKLLDANSYTKTAITVDAKGRRACVRVRYFEGQLGPSQARRGRKKTRRRSTSRPIRGDHRAERARRAASSSRGRDHGWETNDGGETWMRVATNGFPP